MGDPDSGANGQSRDSKGSIMLASDLESSAWTRFDQMVASGKIAYGETTGETMEDEGFKVSHE
jgi:hypothetical protein